MIKVSIHEEDMPIINIYTPHIWISKYIKQILSDFKGETDNTIIVRASIHHKGEIIQTEKSVRKY